MSESIQALYDRLSARAANCLWQANFKTVAQVRLAVQDHSLLKYRNLGKKTFEEIAKALGEVDSLPSGLHRLQTCPHCGKEFELRLGLSCVRWPHE